MNKALPLMVVATLYVNALSCGLASEIAPMTDRPLRQVANVGSPSPSLMTPSEREAQARLAEAGFTKVRNVKSGPEGITAEATKDGREMSLVIDSGGRIRQR